MGTYDENRNYHFSDLTKLELLNNIQKGIVDMSFENDSKTRHGLRNKVYEDIHELYMRLTLYEIVYGTSVMDSWETTISKKDSA